MKMQVFIVAVACVCHGSVFAASQTSPFKFLQKPGPYPVGLKVVDQYDRSRTYADRTGLVAVLRWRMRRGHCKP